MTGSIQAPTTVDVRPGGAGGPTVFAVSGELDLHTADRLTSAALAHFSESGLEPEGFVVFDLTETSFVDSSGLGAIVRIIKRVRADGGRAVLVAPPGSRVLTLLRIVGLDQAIPVAPTLAEVC